MELEVIVRKDRLEVGERSAGLLTRLPATAAGQDLDGLTEYLKRIKARYPDKLDITVLLEQDVSYDVLVQVMDAVRVYAAEGATTGRPIRAELFPEIAIGDAPIVARGR